MTRRHEVTLEPGTFRYRELTLDISLDPVAVAARLARDGGFDTHVVYEAGGRATFAGGVLGEIIVDRHGFTTRWGTEEEEWRPLDGPPLDQVADFLRLAPVGDWRAYGFAAFELGHLQAGRVEMAGDDTLLHLVIPHVQVVLEHDRAVVRATDWDTLDQVADLVCADEAAPVYTTRPLTSDNNGSAYITAVASAVREIRAQRLDKVIVSRVVPVDFDVDLVGTYVVGRRANTPARSFLLRMGDLAATGFSPETLLEVEPDGRVITRLVAGTCARTGDADTDARLRDELLNNPKEVFEHAISVRSAAEDLAKICLPGTVKGHEFMSVQQRGSVQHLDSTITGRLDHGLSCWDAFAKLFPAAAVSGIPRDTAYQAIHRLESEPRGLYSGAVFTCGADGDFDAALALRSIFRAGGRNWLRAGAGIVAQSRPEREHEETREKLRSVSRHLVPVLPYDGELP
ncbi:salicylate synthase [Lentzea sp. NPDC051213]|uniref:salicylate synthase n=1 Tax=Lentzea sp. NPDC051213 TaxID=3364126 RepID=UPI00378C0113